MDKIVKNTYVRARTNIAEKTLIEKKAKEYNLTLSDYIRYCCLLNPPPNPSELKEKNNRGEEEK